MRLACEVAAGCGGSSSEPAASGGDGDANRGGPLGQAGKGTSGASGSSGTRGSGAGQREPSSSDRPSQVMSSVAGRASVRTHGVGRGRDRCAYLRNSPALIEDGQIGWRLPQPAGDQGSCVSALSIAPACVAVRRGDLNGSTMAAPSCGIPHAAEILIRRGMLAQNRRSFSCTNAALNVESAHALEQCRCCRWRTALAAGQRLGSPGARSAEREDAPRSSTSHARGSLSTRTPISPAAVNEQHWVRRSF